MVRTSNSGLVLSFCLVMLQENRYFTFQERIACFYFCYCSITSAQRKVQVRPVLRTIFVDKGSQRSLSHALRLHCSPTDMQYLLIYHYNFSSFPGSELTFAREAQAEQFHFYLFSREFCFSPWHLVWLFCQPCWPLNDHIFYNTEYNKCHLRYRCYNRRCVPAICAFAKKILNSIV